MLEIKNILTNNRHSLKLFSVFFGYMLWTVFDENNQKKIWVKVPLSFYCSDEQQFKIDGPEQIQVQLAGKNNDLKNLDFDTLAVYVDISNLQTGKHVIELKSKNLFLPKNIKLVSYKPLNIFIDLTKT
ncbi:hypothetical protein M1446_00045 [Candidatus Dependentiae bacterium]|nr:hypothetical protein [Candidatus Dependentiae bacterium]